MMPPRTLSVIIPIYNQDALARTHALQSARCLHVPGEIVLVDDGSQAPNLPQVCAAYDWPCRVIYVRVLVDIPWNQPGARNAGAVLATGDVLSFEDADHLPAAKYYVEALAALADPAIAIVQTTRNGAGIAPGSWACRRLDYWRAGAYDEDFSGHYGCDDEDMLAGLRRLGKRAVIRHGFHAVPNGGCRGLARDARHNRRLLRQKKRRPRGNGICHFPFTVTILSEKPPCI